MKRNHCFSPYYSSLFASLEHFLREERGNMKSRGWLVLAVIVFLMVGSAQGGKPDEVVGGGGTFAQPGTTTENRPLILAQEAQIALADKNLDPLEREVLKTMDAYRIMEVVNRYYYVYSFFYEFGSKDVWNKDYKRHNEGQYREALKTVKAACGKETVYLFGTADEVGPSEANMRLCQFRAENLQARLRKDGTSNCQFHITAVGQLQRDLNLSKETKESQVTEAQKKNIAQYRKVDLWVPQINYLFK
jgi:hypothetical protein